MSPKANSHFGNGGGHFNKYKNANRPKKTRKPEKVPPRAATQTARTATSAPASRTKLPIHLPNGGEPQVLGEFFAKYERRRLTHFEGLVQRAAECTAVVNCFIA